MLNETQIKKALNRLSEILQRSGESRSLLIVGGAALQLLGYHHKTVTTDVDNLLPIDEGLKKFIHQVASELGLNENWLNSNSSSFAQKNIDYTIDAITILDTGALTVKVVSLENYIELKVRAQIDRGFDLDDIIALKPKKDFLLELRSKIVREGNHHTYVIDEEFNNIFERLGYDD